VTNKAPGQNAPMTNRQARRAHKRDVARRLAEQRARARRRRQTVTAVIAALAVAAIIVAGVLLLGGKKKTNTAAKPSASSSASATASPAASASTSASFPPLPAGANPALGKKPKVSAGKGNLTALKVTTLIQGKGAAVKSGQTIAVNYVGVTYSDGKEFDSSWKNSAPFSFAIGSGNVIPGWDQGLVGVKVGSRVQLDIPASLAYGENPTGGQPAGALRFVVDVLSAQ
jgi:peptidylprolyl isomerase